MGMDTAVGGDPPGMRQLANRLDSVASRLSRLQSRLSTQLATVEWVGADAQRFRDEWRASHAAALQRMAADLSGAAQAMRSDAARQETVSNR